MGGQQFRRCPHRHPLLPPPTSMTEIANVIMSTKREPKSCCATAKARPFVVTSLSTKRYAPPLAVVKKPEGKQPPSPPPRLRKEGLSAPLGGPLSAVVSRVEPPRHMHKPMLIAALKKTIVQKPPSSRPVLPSDESRMVVPKELLTLTEKTGRRLGYPASMRSTHVATAGSLPPRPSCIPRIRIDRSSVRVAVGSKDKLVVEGSATGLCNPEVVHPRPTIDADETGTVARVEATSLSVKESAVVNDPTGTSAKDRDLTPPQQICHPRALQRASTEQPSSPSTDSPSFPSPTSTIIVDVSQVKTPSTIHGDETILSSVGDVSGSGLRISGMLPEDLCAYSEFGSISPLSSSSGTAVEDQKSPTELTVESDGEVKISSSQKESSDEVSHMLCDTAIILPSRNGASSVTTLASVISNDQASSPINNTDAGNRTRIAIRSSFEIARAFFSSQQSGTKTTATKNVGADAPRIRRLFMPPLDKDAKASKNPMTQMEIEMLRARREVAGGGVADPRLDRLGSLTAMAVVTKYGTSGSDGPSQV